MRAASAWIGMVSLGLGGCAAAGRGAIEPVKDFAVDSPLRIAAARAVDVGVNPMVPVELANEDGAIAVAFGQRGRHQVVTRLDPTSLDALSRESTGRIQTLSAPATGAARVQLDNGRVLVCWTQENTDGGRQALAQLYAADSTPIGLPVVISPADSDVLGAPRAATTDGRHVLVTFTATSGESFELRAVSLEDAQRAAEREQLVRR